MKGVSYVTDEKDKKIAVQIDINYFKSANEDLEDLIDGIIAESRQDEERIPLDAVIKKLKKKR